MIKIKVQVQIDEDKPFKVYVIQHESDGPIYEAALIHPEVVQALAGRTTHSSKLLPLTVSRRLLVIVTKEPAKPTTTPFLINNNPADMKVMARAAMDWFGYKLNQCGGECIEDLADALGEDFEQLCRVRKMIAQYVGWSAEDMSEYMELSSKPPAPEDGRHPVAMTSDATGATGEPQREAPAEGEGGQNL